MHWLPSDRRYSWWDCEARQRVMQAAAGLVAVGREHGAALARGSTHADAEIVAVGAGLNRWCLPVECATQQLLTVRSSLTAPQLRQSVVIDEALVASGVTMTSVFDFDRSTVLARSILGTQAAPQYHFSIAPLDLTLLDGREVVLDGPTLAGKATVMALTSRRAVDAARRYWHAVHRVARRPDQVAEATRRLTTRQERILEHLTHDLTDEAIATALGLSVRTVRSDLADAMRRLGARSRFTAGLLWGQLRGE